MITLMLVASIILIRKIHLYVNIGKWLAIITGKKAHMMRNNQPRNCGRKIEASDTAVSAPEMKRTLARI